MPLTTGSDRRERCDNGLNDVGGIMTKKSTLNRALLPMIVAAATLVLVIAASEADESQTVCATIFAQSAQPGTVVFVDDLESGTILAWGSTPTFSATEIIDIDFVVRLDGQIAGDHLLELRISTPNGHAYQTLTVPISTDERSVGEISVVGFPRPLRVRFLEPEAIDGRSLLSAVVAFPVGGTNIATGSLFGLWSVEPFLNGQSIACNQIARFIVVD